MCRRPGNGWGGTGPGSGAINSDAANIINGNVLNIKAPADREAASPLRQDGTDELTPVSQGEARERKCNLSPPVGFGSKARRTELMECFGPTAACLSVLFIRQREIIAFVCSGYLFSVFVVVVVVFLLLFFF